MSEMIDDSSIGVFDSGVGGLTVVRSLREKLPHEELIYLGDTARVPYGSKSAETVARYSKVSANFLLQQGVKMIVVACNTASAFALDDLRNTLGVPVLGAVEPGAQAAVAATRSGHIGVIGTLGTIRSGAYPRAIAAAAHARKIKVSTRACPLLVPLAEEGWTGDAIAEAIARRYLAELASQAADIDVLVLGCTHYPLLRAVLESVARDLFRHDVALVDSADAMAMAAREQLNLLGLHRKHGEGSLRCYVTDEARIDEIGRRFLGRDLGDVTHVDL
jgi:glutamate racemase